MPSPIPPGMPGRVPFVEPSGPLHWKPGSVNVDGAVCGAQGEPFTASIELVECPACRRAWIDGGAGVPAPVAPAALDPAAVR